MTTLLDRLTGRVTMYRLMVLVLGGIAAVALILSLFPGGLSYTPLQLLASLATLLVVGYLSNRLFGLVFRVTPHGESSVITSLLLFFLFFPTATASGLLILAFIAVIASASKYLLAVRGRHVFNPVAIAAFVIALTQLSGATWWVATPFLLAPVLIGGILVVYRTRRFALVGTFLAVALVITVVRLGIGGTDVGTALWFAVGSAPLLFFGAFMVDEPLTQPPLRWQQLAVAVLVGVLYSVPFSFGPIYTSPELALVVGNLVAFLFGQRRGIRLDFVGSRMLTPTTRELTFAPHRPVAFRAGQYMEISLPHHRADTRGVRRTFSIASAPGSSDVAFGLKVPESASSFKSAVIGLEPGASLRGTSVGGDFVLPTDAGTPLLLVAGGIGITPFISQLRHLVLDGEVRDIVLVYAVSDASELAYIDELQLSAVPVLVVAPEAPVAMPATWTWIGAGRLTADRLADFVPDLTARRAFVSGPPALVTALKRDLRSLGVKRITTDYFTGY